MEQDGPFQALITFKPKQTKAPSIDAGSFFMRDSKGAAWDF